MDNHFIYLLIVIAIATVISIFFLRIKKTDLWYKYDISADVMDNALNRTNANTVHHLEDECYLPFKIKCDRDVRRAERVLIRRYRTKIVRITAYELVGTTRF